MKLLKIELSQTIMMRLYQRSIPNINLDILNCREGVFQWGAYLEKLYTMNKSWEDVGFAISITFLIYSLISFLLGYKNLELKRSLSDFRCKIYYSYFLYPKVKNKSVFFEVAICNS